VGGYYGIKERPSEALVVWTAPIHPMAGFVAAGSLPKSLRLSLPKLSLQSGNRRIIQPRRMHT